MTDLITVIVYSESNCEDKIPDNAAEFMDFWQRKVDLIPAEFMDSSEIYCRPSEYYDSPLLGVMVSYKRPKTEDEIAADKQHAETDREITEDRERHLLAELLAKYPQ